MSVDDEPRARALPPWTRWPSVLVQLVMATAAACVVAPPADADTEPEPTSELDVGGLDAGCAPTVHRLDDDVAIFGCEAQVAAVRGSDSPTSSLDVTLGDDAGPGVAFQPGKRLHDCTWHSFTASTKTMMVTCPDGSHVVSGGCLSQTPMMVSAPWESNSFGDLPEDGERYQDLADANGWACSYDGATGSGQIASALCCE